MQPPRSAVTPEEHKRARLIATAAVLAIIAVIAFRIETAPPRSEPVADEAPKSAGPNSLQVMTLAEMRLREALRDPDSAELRNTRVPTGAGYMCGEVNSTNGFGGKAGYQRFIAGASSEMPVVLEEAIEAAEFESVWSRLC